MIEKIDFIDSIDKRDRPMDGWKDGWIYGQMDGFAKAKPGLVSHKPSKFGDVTHV